MSRNTLLINGLFLFAIMISLVLIQKFLIGHMPSSSKASDSTPDAYLMDVTYFRTTPTGEREVVIACPLVTHYKLRDTAIFAQPNIALQQKGEQWQITANQGQSQHGAKTIYLSQHVNVTQMMPKNKVGTRLRTDTLTIFPKQRQVMTRDFVTIGRPGVNITAVGLTGDLNTGNFRLLSNTKGHYDPKQTQ